MRASGNPEAAFLAAMTANATHEVRNVLAIIKESAGLIGDLVALCSRGKPLDTSKVDRAIGRVDSQVKRGADILTGLNRLSHSLDSQEAPVDLDQELAQMILLCQRLARKRNQSLTQESGDPSAIVTLHPLRLQMLLFAATEWCMENHADGSAISAGVTRRGSRIDLSFKATPPQGGGNPDQVPGGSLESLELLAGSVGGTVTAHPGEAGIRISFGSL